jgi:hypothetical protein
LKNTQDEAIKFFNEFISNLNQKNNEFKNNVDSYFSRVSFKVLQIYNVDKITEKGKNKEENILIRDYINKCIQKLKKIIKLYEEIFEIIKNTTSIFYSFLDISNYLNEKKSMKIFMNKHCKKIEDNWIYSKINTEDIEKIVSPKQYMIHSKKDFSCLDDNQKSEITFMLEKGKKLISNSLKNLVSLNLENIFFADLYFDNTILYDKIKKLKLNNITLDNRKEDNNFLKNMPNIKKLTIIGSNSFELGLLKSLSSSLVKLSLDKNGLINSELYSIFKNC